MKLKTERKTAGLIPEGEYHDAMLKQVAYKNDDKKAILNLEITHAGQTLQVPFEGPASIDSGPLRKALEILNGAEFTSKQIQDGIDPEAFIGRKCRVMIVHKRTSGKRMVAVVQVVLPSLAVEPKPTVPPPSAPVTIPNAPTE